MAKLKSLLGMTRALGDWARNAGLSFNGHRNLYHTYGYPNKVTYDQMLAKYIRQDIAKTIVDKPANAIWDSPPTITTGNAFQEAFDGIVAKHKLWKVFGRADKLAGLGNYSTVLMGLNDGKDLMLPVTPNERNQIIYLQPYSEKSMRIQALVVDPKNSRFGKPEFYTLTPSQPNTPDSTIFAGSPPSIGRVHASRVLHIAEDILEDEVCGIPRLLGHYNLLEDLMKVAGGSAEVYWLNSRAGMQVDIDKEMQLEPEDETALSEEIEDYTNNLRRIVRTRGVKMNVLDATLNDPSSTFNINMSLHAARSRIPQRIMMGAEAGQLASEQDRANWAETVQDRRANFAVPSVIIPFFEQLELIGLAPVGTSLKLGIAWPEAFKLSPLERSQTSAQQARSAANLTKAMDTNPDIMSTDEARSIISLGNASSLDLADGAKQTSKKTPTDTTDQSETE